MENLNFTVTDDLLASKGQRFLNFIIDLLIQYILLLSLRTTVSIIADITKNFNLSNWIDSMSAWEQFISGIITLLFYYNLTEMYLSRSLAKFTTSTIVVTKLGLKPDNKTIFWRTLCRLIPFEALTFFNKDLRGLHDTLSETYVVKKKLLETRKGIVLMP